MGFILLLDRITKYGALSGWFLDTWIPFFSCNIAINRGIAWGLLDGGSQEQFIVVSSIIVCIIVYLILQTYLQWKNNQVVWPYIVVLAGALSNVIDRIFYGAVIDFIHVSWQGFSWPIFNVADACIVIGVGCIVIKELQA